MILVLISPRNAGLPFAQWLSEENGRLVAVTADGVAVGEGFAEVVTVADYSDDDAVLDAARDAARRHRAAGHPGAGRSRCRAGRPAARRVQPARTRHRSPRRPTATRSSMKKYARAAGIRVPEFAPVTTAGDIADFMARPSGAGRGQAPRRFGLHRGLCARHAGAGGRPRRCRIGPAVPGRGIRRRCSSSCRRVPGRPDSGCSGRIPVHRPGLPRTLDRCPVRLPHARYCRPACAIDWCTRPGGSWMHYHRRRTVCVHAEFFVTAERRDRALRSGRTHRRRPDTAMLRHVLGIDPRELWSRVECGLPTDLRRGA